MIPQHEAHIHYGDQYINISSPLFDDYVFQEILKTKSFYEIRFLEYLKFVVRKHGAIIDAGANIGNHSLFFSLVMKRQTLSFEPNPIAHDALQKNIHLNHSIAECFPLGLADGPGYTRILFDGILEKNIGMAKLDTRTTEPSDIRLTSIDDFLANYPGNRSIAAIKIDVEGYEERVLRGATKTLKKMRPSIFAEAQDTASFEELAALLLASGYSPVKVMGATPMWHFAPNERYSEFILSNT